MAAPDDKHVMLSYNHGSKDLVKKVYEILTAANIAVWYDERDMNGDLYDGMAEAVDKAHTVCCFLTEKYENSPNCKLEFEYSKALGKKIIICMAVSRKVWKPTQGKWLDLVSKPLLALDFSDGSEDGITMKTQELIRIIKKEKTEADDKTVVPKEKPMSEADKLLIKIKQNYLWNNQLHRILDETKSFPIQDSYINLSMVTKKEQEEKEKKMNEVQKTGAEILGAYEEIYGTKTAIKVEELFAKSKEPVKKVLILGRAGIGKSAFCQYVTYRWAAGELWQEYQLVALVRLRRLTKERYPNPEYHSSDLFRKELFAGKKLDKKELEVLERICADEKVLWILDGYDEFVQNIPPQLQDAFDDIIKNHHHILTSRPYAINLSYKRPLEIIGFVDDDIPKYLESFFKQTEEQAGDTKGRLSSLMNFMKSNSSVWGVAHIPINLELIASSWTVNQSDFTQDVTLTQLYKTFVMTLCRTYLKKKDPKTEQQRDTWIEQKLRTELQFLSTLAFEAINSENIIISPTLIEKIEKLTRTNLDKTNDVLRIGILKRYDAALKQTQRDLEKSYYFVHLSFQEYFAARELVRRFREERESAEAFIHENKYNRRYTLVFIFAAGLLSMEGDSSSLLEFVKTVDSEPKDLIGYRHIQLLIPLYDECSTFHQNDYFVTLLHRICEWTSYTIRNRTYSLIKQSINTLKTTNRLVQQSELHAVMLEAVRNKDSDVRWVACGIMGAIGEKAATETTIRAITEALRDIDSDVRHAACKALGAMGEKTATENTIKALTDALRDKRSGVSDDDPYLNHQDSQVTTAVCEALATMGEKAATEATIRALIEIFRDESSDVRNAACKALGAMGEKAATETTITLLIEALRDENSDVRNAACEALGAMGEKAATKTTINALVEVLRDERSSSNHDDSYQSDEDSEVREAACRALKKMGEKAATDTTIEALNAALRDGHSNVNIAACEALVAMGKRAATDTTINKLIEVLREGGENTRQAAREALVTMSKQVATETIIKPLIEALRDKESGVRTAAREALVAIGEKVATETTITALIEALRDGNSWMNNDASEALGAMAEKAATETTINALIEVLRDENQGVSEDVCESLRKMGEKAATETIIKALIEGLRDEECSVRRAACRALGKMGEKAATETTINALIEILRDDSSDVRNAACEALGAMGEKAATETIIEALIEILRDESSYVRSDACWTLGKMGEKAATETTINALIEALRDESSDVRSAACWALVKMGEKAATETTINALIEALRDESSDVRSAACWALVKMGEKAATETIIIGLIGALEDEKLGVRRAACGALGAMGEKAATETTINTLIKALRDEHQCVREDACEALGAMGEKAATKTTINALIEALRDEHQRVREYACGALGAMGEKAVTEITINALAEALRDKESVVRRAAREALLGMGEKAATETIINALIVVFRDGNSWVRYDACEALAAMGEKRTTETTINTLIDACCASGMVHNAFFRSEFPFDSWSCADVAKLSILKWSLEETDFALDVCSIFSLGGNIAITQYENMLKFYGTKKDAVVLAFDGRRVPALFHALRNSLKKLNVPLEDESEQAGTQSMENDVEPQLSSPKPSTSAVTQKGSSSCVVL